MSMTPPCRRKWSHRHTVAWIESSGRRGHVSDRCRSLMLWSSLCFHLLAGDLCTLDGAPFVDRDWAEEYLLGMETRPMARSTARGIRNSLAARRRRDLRNRA